MKSKDAITALGALAHETRLKVFRLLVRQGADGLPAGAVASRLGVHPATLSHHLGLLERAGLLTARRHARQITYAADFHGMGRLLAYLTEDCCRGLPEIRAAVRPVAANATTDETNEEIEA